MGLRELAKKDARYTIEGAQAGNTVFTLSDLAGHSWEIPGFIGDIGYSVDTEGNRVAGRTVCASFLAERVKLDGKTITPAPNWKIVYKDLEDEEHAARVSFAEPDRTVGIMRLFLALDLEKAEE